jgi:hypothetical protein
MYSEQSGVCGIIQKTWRDIDRFSQREDGVKKERAGHAVQESSVTSMNFSLNPPVSFATREMKR